MDQLADGLATRSTSQPPCSWCANPFHEIRCSGLCDHCYRITREQNAIKQKIQQRKAKGLQVPYELAFSYRVAIEMEKLAKSESEHFDSKDSFHTGMTIERLMMYVSEEWIRHSYYSNYASIFSQLFSPAQRRALIYLLSRMIREHMRRNRRRKAVQRLADQGIHCLPPPPAK